jgi:hypothetical protein
MGHFLSLIWGWPAGDPGIVFLRLSLEKTHELSAFSGLRHAWKYCALAVLRGREVK